MRCVGKSDVMMRDAPSKLKSPGRLIRLFEDTVRDHTSSRDRADSNGRRRIIYTEDPFAGVGSQRYIYNEGIRLHVKTVDESCSLRIAGRFIFNAIL